MIAGPQDVADRRHSLVQDGKIDCEGAAASPSGILGSPSENGDLRRGHIGSWRFTDDERIEDIVRCRSYDGIYSPFLTPHRRTFWAGRDTGRYPITEEAPQINGAGVGYTGYPVRQRKKNLTSCCQGVDSRDQKIFGNLHNSISHCYYIEKCMRNLHTDFIMLVMTQHDIPAPPDSTPPRRSGKLSVTKP